MMRSRADRAPYRGERFAALKDIFELTQGELGERLGVTQAFISRIIRLDRSVPPSLAVDAAVQFNLPLSFFSVDPAPGEGAVPTFRKNSRATMFAERRVIQLHREASRLWHYVSSLSEYRDTTVLSSVLKDASDDMERLALNLREVVGNEPGSAIPNVARFIEKLGIGVVTALDPDYPVAADGYRHHTGISTPSSLNKRPLISLVGDLPGGVQRLTLAHELGHLLLDRDREARISSIRSVEERRAFAFAGALLLPEEIMRQRVSAATTLRGYANVAAEFGVTVPAAVQRAKQLGLIDESRNKSLQIQINTVGWRKKDPVQITPEKALLLKQAAARVWPVSTSAQAAEHSGTAVEWVDSWLGSEPDRGEQGNQANVVSLDDWRNRASSR